MSYEAAWTLVSLSTAPTAVRACAQTYATLLTSSGDNNVKLIVLDRLAELKKHHSKVLQEILMDILRALSSPNIDICKKTLALAIDLVSPRSIEEVVQVLKREVVRAQESDLEHGEEYKTLLIQAIHRCATRYAEVADSIVLVLLDFLAGEGGYDVMQCVKSIVEQYPSFRSSVVRKVIDNLDEITEANAMRMATWLLGEYAESLDAAVRHFSCAYKCCACLCVCMCLRSYSWPSSNLAITMQSGEPMLVDAYEAIRGLMGEPPFIAAAKEGGTGESDKKEEPVTTTVTKNIVLADGTYASVTSTETVGAAADTENCPHLRKQVCGGDILLGTVISVALVRMALKAGRGATDSHTSYKMTTGALSVAVGVARLAETKKGTRVGVHADCLARLSQCCRILLDPVVKQKMSDIWLRSGQEAFSALVASQKAVKSKASEQDKRGRSSQADDLIQFRQLRAQAVQGGLENDLMDADDISRAIGADGAGAEGSKLKHVYQLTGYSDPVYAEASVTVHDYDIVLEMLVINRTPNTLTNLTVELATMGDLKLVERPQSYTIGPLDERRLRANIKVSSTETGHIFGTIVFDNSSTAQKTYVNLNDIQLDIMDYIRPAECKGGDFRSMWAEFEWENKVCIDDRWTNEGRR